MKPLNVALVVKNTPSGFERDDRSKGYFSYEVPEFTWSHFVLGDGFKWDTDKWGAIGFDLVVQESINWKGRPMEQNSQGRTRIRHHLGRSAFPFS